MSAIADILAIVNSNPNKTLDELFLEHLGLGASDSTLKTLYTGKKYISKESQIGEGFVPSVDGTIRCISKFSRTGIVDQVYLYVYEDENKVATHIFAGSEIDSGEVSFDFNIKANRNYYITSAFHGDEGDVYCLSLKVCGSISDPTLIK